jgi:hypothetical protein
MILADAWHQCRNVDQFFFITGRIFFDVSQITGDQVTTTRRCNTKNKQKTPVFHIAKHSDAALCHEARNVVGVRGERARPHQLAPADNDERLLGGALEPRHNIVFGCAAFSHGQMRFGVRV